MQHHTLSLYNPIHLLLHIANGLETTECVDMFDRNCIGNSVLRKKARV